MHPEGDGGGRIRTHSTPCIYLVRIPAARGGLGARSAHAQWATLMRADTSHVVSGVTVLSNVTFKDSRSLERRRARAHAHTRARASLQPRAAQCRVATWSCCDTSLASLSRYVGLYCFHGSADEAEATPSSLAATLRQ